MTLKLPDLFSDSAGKVGDDHRPYYNNLLALQCQLPYALDRDLGAEDYVTRFVQNWNFSAQFDFLQSEKFSHEFSHILLEMALTIMQRNPFPFVFGYNGNSQAESVVLAMEHIIYKPEMIDFTDGDLFADRYEFYYSSYEVASDWLNEKQAKQDVMDGIANTVFEARRARCFDNESDSVIKETSRDFINDIPSITRCDLIDIWNAVEPFFKEVDDIWKRLGSTAPDDQWKMGISIWMRQIKIRDLYACLNKKDGVKPSLQILTP